MKGRTHLVICHLPLSFAIFSPIITLIWRAFFLVIQRENVWIPPKSLLFSTITKEPYKLFSLIFFLLYFSSSHFSPQQNRPLVLVLLLAMSVENLWGNVFIRSNWIRCKVSGSTSSFRLMNFYKALITSLDGEGGKGSRGELAAGHNIQKKLIWLTMDICTS